MLVIELIRRLKKYPEDMEVMGANIDYELFDILKVKQTDISFDQYKYSKNEVVLIVLNTL